MKEFWKPITGYEDSYLVSNLGNVKSIDRLVNSALPNVEKQKRIGQHLNVKR